MTDKSEFSFAVVRFSEQTYQSGGVVAVIKGAILDRISECRCEGKAFRWKRG
jgi:hypothetical protein